MMRVLVTGAGGFIGSHVVRALALQNCEVFAVVRNQGIPSRNPAASWHEPEPHGDGNSNRTHGVCPDRGSGAREHQSDRSVYPVDLDLNNGPAVRSALQSIHPHVAVHLAWYTQPGKYWSAPENLDCLAMSLSLARALAESGCKRLVAAGTCAEYDWNDEELSEETTPLKPRGLYGICKNALRETLELFCLQASVQFAWLRFFYLYGPGEAKERLVPTVIRSLLTGTPVRCSSGEHARDYLYVEDAASAVAALAQSQETGCFNVASGQPTKVRTVVEKIAELLDHPECIALGAVPDHRSEPLSVTADVRRLAHTLGWRPSYTLDEALVRTVDWWRANS